MAKISRIHKMGVKKRVDMPCGGAAGLPVWMRSQVIGLRRASEPSLGVFVAHNTYMHNMNKRGGR